ncbi:MAG: metallophosphoesterase [Candidatus Nanohaloarchaea archaeon]|nr:metallophosphoesterase [Candidatus Nanohaloarchaea archaeon]
MDYLIIGDPHGDLPDIDPQDHDAIITTGDYGYNQKQRQAFAGARTRDSQYRAAQQGLAAGRQILEDLDHDDTPVYTVRGNWDFAYDDLTADLDSIKQADNSTETGDATIVGYGTEEFVTEPEIPYDQFGVNEDTFEDAFFSYRDDNISIKELADELTVGEQLLQDFCDKYEDDYSELAATLEEAGNPQILLSHSPPFNTELDQIDSPDNPKHGRHYGSIIVRELIDNMQPDMAISGHIHEGEGIDTLGDTTCINAGLRGTYRITIEDKNIRLEEPDHADR